MKILITLIVITIINIHAFKAYSQNLLIGGNAGGAVTWGNYNSNDFMEDYKSIPTLGYEAGINLQFEVSKQFSLHTELLYTNKGRHIQDRNNENNYIKDHFQFTEATGLLQYRMGSSPAWLVLSAGPRLGYWLGGNGKVLVDEFVAGNAGPRNYKTVFNESLANDEYRFTNPNRLIIGLDAGIGGRFKVYDHWIMADLRYTMGHTHLGNPDSEYVNDLGFPSNNQFSIQAVTFKITYMIDWTHIAALFEGEEREEE